MKFTLQRIRLNQGDYTDRGCYYGIGLPLWFAASDDGSVALEFRSRDRETAKRYVRETTPNASFYR